MRSTSFTRALALAGALLTGALPRLAQADPALEWNLHGITTSVAANQGPILSSRTLALMHAALHPEYPCAHCINAAAVATVLQALEGDPGSLSMTSPTLPGAERRWTRLADYSAEVSNARIWSGVHYRFSTEVGARMGRAVGEFIIRKLTRPV